MESPDLHFQGGPEQSVLGQQTGSPGGGLTLSCRLRWLARTTRGGLDVLQDGVVGVSPANTSPLEDHLSRARPGGLRGPATLVSGHLEFSLKTTALKPHARDTWEQNCSYPGSV